MLWRGWNPHRALSQNPCFRRAEVFIIRPMDKDGLQRLKHLGQKREALSPHRYSRFIRWMRVVLPMAAIGILALLAAWPRMEETFEILPKESVLPQTVGKNELLNPRFESTDEKSQPYTVTAARALQDAHDPEAVLLDDPTADITLKDGTWIAARAQNGTYRQKEERLFLEGNVRLFHDQGYEIKTSALLVDLKKNDARSDRPVSGQGPAGTLDAAGFEARIDTERLIFTGPAKLVLYRRIEGL